jgi:hypothetical protein
MKQMKNGWCPLLVIIAFAFILAASATAETYISYNGKFRIEVPDTWKRLDYRTVDYYLYEGTGDPSSLNYEAVFSPTEGKAFADSAYLIITLDTVGNLTESQIDSVIAVLSEAFEGGVKHHTTGNVVTNIASDQPIYNQSDSTVVIISELEQEDGTRKTSMLVVKFYDQGMANFYFYAPESSFEQDRLVFAQVAASFSTQNLDVTTPSEEVKVADLESRREEPRSRAWVYILIGVVTIVIVVLFSRRNRKSRKAAS